jgi:hypothetical protein
MIKATIMVNAAADPTMSAESDFNTVTGFVIFGKKEVSFVVTFISNIEISTSSGMTWNIIPSRSGIKSQ